MAATIIPFPKPVEGDSSTAVRARRAQREAFINRSITQLERELQLLRSVMAVLQRARGELA